MERNDNRNHRARRDTNHMTTGTTRVAQRNTSRPTRGRRKNWMVKKKRVFIIGLLDNRPPGVMTQRTLWELFPVPHLWGFQRYSLCHVSNRGTSGVSPVPRVGSRIQKGLHHSIAGQSSTGCDDSASPLQELFPVPHSSSFTGFSMRHVSNRGMSGVFPGATCQIRAF